MFGLGDKVQAKGDPVKDVTEATFMADVIEASQTVPVIVDFWAPWCGPCKTLGPMLEAAVTAANGKVRMVKVDVDENQRIAAQLRIQSIPTVYAFWQGQPVDGFQGAVPGSEIKKPSSTASRPWPVMAGWPRRSRRPRRCWPKALRSMPPKPSPRSWAKSRSNAAAYGGLVRAHLALGELDQAEALRRSPPPPRSPRPRRSRPRGRRSNWPGRPPMPDPRPSCAPRSRRTPNDRQARFDLAAGAACRRQGRRGGGRAAGTVPPRPRMERRRGQDAAVHHLRGAEAAGPDCAARPPPSVVDDICLTPGRGLGCMTMMNAADLPETIPVFPLARGAAAAACPAAAAHLRAALPADARRLPEDQAPADRHDPAARDARHGRRAGEKRLQAIGCAGRLTGFSETEDGRYMITLSGISRFRVLAGGAGLHPLPPLPGRLGALRARPGPDRGRPRLSPRARSWRFWAAISPRMKLSTDWDSLKEAEPELLINSLSMLCPFAPEDKQALLEAPIADDPARDAGDADRIRPARRRRMRR